jgi:hypothetical protein
MTNISKTIYTLCAALWGAFLLTAVLHNPLLTCLFKGIVWILAFAALLSVTSELYSGAHMRRTIGEFYDRYIAERYTLLVTLVAVAFLLHMPITAAAFIVLHLLSVYNSRPSAR